MNDIGIRLTASGDGPTVAAIGAVEGALEKMGSTGAASGTLVGTALAKLKDGAAAVTASPLWGMIGGGVITAGFASLVTGTLSGAAALQHMHEQTGVSVESLSALRSVAKLSGTDFDSVGGALQKLSKSMIDAQGGTGKQAETFKALSISITDAQGRMKSADAVLLEMAQSLQRFEAGAGTTTAMMNLLGKSGAELGPVLADLAEKGNLNGKVTAQQAELADRYEKQLAKLKGTIGAQLTPVVLQLIPVIAKLTDLIKPALEVGAAWLVWMYAVPAALALGSAAFNAFALAVYEGTTAQVAFQAAITGSIAATRTAIVEAGVLKSAGMLAIAAWAGFEVGTWLRQFEIVRVAAVAFVDGSITGLHYLQYAGEMLWLAFKDMAFGAYAAVGSGFAALLDGMAGGLRAVGLGAWGGEVASFADSMRGATASGIDFAAESARLGAELDKANAFTHAITASMFEEATAQDKVATATKEHKEQLNLTGEVAAATRDKLAQAYAVFRGKVLDQIATGQIELDYQGKATEADKLRIELARQLELHTLSLTAAQRSYINGLIDKRAAQIQDIKWMQETRAENDKALTALTNLTGKLQDAAQKQRDLNTTYGLSADELTALEIARLSDQAALKDHAAAVMDEIDWTHQLGDEYRRQAAALRETIQAQADFAPIKAARDTAAEWRKTADSIENGLTDALDRAFLAGRGFAQALRDQLLSVFNSLVLRPMIQAVVAPFVGAATGSASAAGSAAGSAGGSALGSMGGSMLGSLGLGSSSGMGSIFGSGASLTMSGAGGTELALQGAGSMMTNGSILQGASQAAGALAPWAAGFTAGHYVGQAISGGFSVAGNSGNTAVNAGAIIGAIAGGPIGAAIGGAIGGLVNRTFGMGQTEVQSAGVTGTVGGGSFSGQTYSDWYKRGGLLRHSQTGTDMGALDATTATAFNTAAAAVLAQTQAYAKALKLPADSLSSVSTQIRVQLGSDAAANTDAINKAFGAYQDQLSAQFAATLTPFEKAGETLTQTLVRLAGLQTFSDTLNQFGGVFGQIAHLSVDAKQGLIDLAGGMQALATKANAFVDGYYTDAEKYGLAATQLEQQLSALGIGADQIGKLGSTADFRALVEGTNASTSAGQAQLNGLLDLSQSFLPIGQYLQQQGTTLADLASQAPATTQLANILGAGADKQVTATNAVTTAVNAQTQTLASMLQRLIAVAGNPATPAAATAAPGAPVLSYETGGYSDPNRP